MIPQDYSQFIGPQPQYLAEWSSLTGGKINFQLLVRVPMSRNDAEYLFSVLDLAKKVIERSLAPIEQGGEGER
jgi:hypothetical protein